MRQNLQRVIELFRGHHEERRARATATIERCQGEIEEIDRDLAELARLEELVSGAELTPSDGAASGSSHLPPRPSLSPPSSGRRLRPSQERALANQQELLKTLRRFDRPLGRAELLDATALSTSELYGALRALQATGAVVKHGDGRNTLYTDAGGSASGPAGEGAKSEAAPTPPPTEPPNASRGSQEITVPTGTPEGRVLEYCQLNPNSSGPAVSLALGIGLNDLRPIFGSLMREGLLRTGHKNGETVYRAVVL